jgi:hypothetical protein
MLAHRYEIRIQCLPHLDKSEGTKNSADSLKLNVNKKVVTVFNQRPASFPETVIIMNIAI